ncbi:30S ribosomal protein S20 [Candidatus Peregrinibacteria bacterium]|nr:30S ribosomal protein S20 [Candidatus Peregrinibacteria bacterium]
MPLTLSAIKAAKQAEARRIRRQPFKTQLKTTMRAFIDLIKDGKKDEAAKILPRVYKVIDTAAKKHILHPKNAARKKSRMARLLK